MSESMAGLSAIYKEVTDTMRIRSNTPGFLSAELLVEPITVMQPAQVSDGEGGYTVTYTATGTIWGHYVPLGQDRTLIAAEVTYTDSARVYVRYPLTIDNTYKLQINGVEYAIHSITDINNRKEYLEIVIFN